jgi:DNA polymerase III delta subunit
MGSDKTEIKTSDILAIVSPNNEQPFFRFIDELISKRISFSLKTLRQLILQGENAIGLVTYLLNNLRLLLQARSLIDEGYVSELKIPTTYRKTWVETFIQSLPENLRNSSLKESNFFKQHPYRFFLLLKQSMNFKAAELKNIFLDACEAYWELVNSRPSEKVLEKLTLKIKAG